MLVSSIWGDDVGRDSSRFLNIIYGSSVWWYRVDTEREISLLARMPPDAEELLSLVNAE